MAKRRRRSDREEEQLELEQMLEPYETTYEEIDWQDENMQDEPQYADMYLDQSYIEEYSEEQEAVDLQGRINLAMGFVDLVSILIGVVVILVLVAMLVALFSWLNNDIMHSALLMQSGLQ